MARARSDRPSTTTRWNSRRSRSTPMAVRGCSWVLSLGGQRSVEQLDAAADRHPGGGAEGPLVPDAAAHRQAARHPCAVAAADEDRSCDRGAGVERAAGSSGRRRPGDDLARRRARWTTRLPEVRPQAEVYRPIPSGATDRGVEVGDRPRAAGPWHDPSVDGFAITRAVPAESIRKVLFQPDRGAWSSRRCRSAPTPSGAPVSPMSKKSAFTPATALSARSHCVIGARARIAVPLTWSRTSPGWSSRAVRTCTCTGPCCSSRVHREYSSPGATVQPTSSVSSAPSRERRWATSARVGPRTPSELCTVGPGEVFGRALPGRRQGRSRQAGSGT